MHTELKQQEWDMADNLKMAMPGTQFTDGPVSLAWGVGREASEVIAIPPAERSSTLVEAILIGVVVETNDPVTTSPTPSPALFIRLSAAPEDGQTIVYNEATGLWDPAAGGGGGGGAPTNVNYLVGTASGGLSAEIPVGTTPGGELGGTWAAPTVDVTHSGSTHAAAAATGQAAAEATAAAALNAHISDATDAHDASAISIADAGSKYTATEVEGALAEIATDIETLSSTPSLPGGGDIGNELLRTAGGLSPEADWFPALLSGQVARHRGEWDAETDNYVRGDMAQKETAFWVALVDVPVADDPSDESGRWLTPDFPLVITFDGGPNNGDLGIRAPARSILIDTDDSRVWFLRDFDGADRWKEMALAVDTPFSQDARFHITQDATGGTFDISIEYLTEFGEVLTEHPFGLFPLYTVTIPFDATPEAILALIVAATPSGAGTIDFVDDPWIHVDGDDAHDFTLIFQSGWGSQPFGFSGDPTNLTGTSDGLQVTEVAGSTGVIDENGEPGYLSARQVFNDGLGNFILSNATDLHSLIGQIDNKMAGYDAATNAVYATVQDTDYDVGAEIAGSSNRNYVALLVEYAGEITAERTVTLPPLSDGNILVQGYLGVCDITGQVTPTNKIHIVCADSDVIVNGGAGPAPSSFYDLTTPYARVEFVPVFNNIGPTVWQIRAIGPVA